MNTSSDSNPFVSSHAEVEKVPWQQATPATWVPLRHNLKEVEDSEHSAKQAQKNIELRKTELQQQNEAGYDAGYTSGSLAAQREVAAMRAAYAEALQRLTQTRQTIMTQTQGDLLRLCLHIAGQVLLTDQEGRRTFTRLMVEQGLTVLRDAERLTVRLPPAELEYLQKNAPELLRQPKVEWSADPSLVLGGAQVVSDLGVIDSTLEHRLAEMATQLHAVHEAAATADRKGKS